jgi:hypothetical protein
MPFLPKLTPKLPNNAVIPTFPALGHRRQYLPADRSLSAIYDQVYGFLLRYKRNSNPYLPEMDAFGWYIVPSTEYSAFFSFWLSAN